jgi:hypothetical protein
MTHSVIHLHVAAPSKPLFGAACNGCGVCCSWQPCPLGVLVTGRRNGACAALRWHDAEQHYRCTMVDAPEAAWPALPAALRGPLRRLARRWIAAGAGCDSQLEVEAGASSA